uniref:Fibronectin type III-like domain-containing protein n=1 Tax=Prevotella sp. GTC17262 TaxID=3236797 RepID=A0AB33JKC1_9BACT
MAAQQAPQLHADNIDEIVKSMTLEEKALIVVGSNAGQVNSNLGQSAKLVPGAAGTTCAIPRLGITPAVLADGPAGLRIDPKRDFDSKTYYCTHFPIGTCLSSSWNTDLVKQVGTAIGNEVLEYGADVLLAPGVCLHRNPLCGRNFEYYSEDPVLSGHIAAAYILGVQSQGIGTSIKHYAFNNQETARLGNDARVSQRAARELYLKNFEIAIKKAQPWTVMSSYNGVNGTQASERYDLMTTVLRDEWGFKGIVMTDWFGGTDPVWRDGKSDRVANMKAGNDLIEPGQPIDSKTIEEAVKSGKLDEKVLDLNVKRILEMIVKTPRFKGYKYSDAPDLKAHAQVTRNSAAEINKVTYEWWQNKPLPKEAVPTDADLSKAVEANDVAVITLERLSGEGSDRTAADFNLAANELQLIQKVTEAFHQAGKKTVVVLNIGGVIESASWKHIPDAVLLPWQCGQEFGNSVADILSGRLAPSGKLPMTWPITFGDVPSSKNFPSDGIAVNFEDRNAGRYRTVKNVGYTNYEEDIYVGYRYFDSFNKNVSYPFGYGLSYTSFEYSDVKAVDRGNSVVVSVTVKNTGDRMGKEVVEVYVTAPKGKVNKPAQELKAFAKTRALKPGETETLSMEIEKTELASFNEKPNAWVADAGIYTFKVGASSRDIKGTVTLKLKASTMKVYKILEPKQKLNLLQ